MMLTHDQQTKNILASYDENALGFFWAAPPSPGAPLPLGSPQPGTDHDHLPEPR